jgi:Xaa-Pro aminopeptidase
MTGTTMPPTHITADDQAEFERRLGATRSLMAEHGFDAIVATDDHTILGLAPAAAQRQPPYARYLSGFYIPSQLHPHATTAVVPAEGDPVLLLPPGIQRSYVHLAQSRSWIRSIVDLYVDDPAWETRTRWGWSATDMDDAAAEWLRDRGLDAARIGVAGEAKEFEALRRLLPKASFEPTLTTEREGRAVDLLEPLLASNSDWEIRQLEAAHAAGDAMTSAFVTAAVDGATAREARARAYGAGIAAGADDIIMFGSIGVEPWTYWDWGLPVDEEFERGRLYFFQAAICAVNGYEIQSARSFVVGAPSREHVHIHDTMQRALDAIRAQVTPGAPGGELYAVGLDVVQKADLALWGQLGHGMGYKAHAAPRGAALTENNPRTLVAGQALVLHACVVDKDHGESGMLGDTILVEPDGGFRYAARQPLSSDLVTGATAG